MVCCVGCTRWLTVMMTLTKEMLETNFDMKEVNMKNVMTERVGKHFPKGLQIILLDYILQIRNMYSDCAV